MGDVARSQTPAEAPQTPRVDAAGVLSLERLRGATATATTAAALAAEARAEAAERTLAEAAKTVVEAREATDDEARRRRDRLHVAELEVEVALARSRAAWAHDDEVREREAREAREAQQREERELDRLRGEIAPLRIIVRRGEEEARRRTVVGGLVVGLSLGLVVGPLGGTHAPLGALAAAALPLVLRTAPQTSTATVAGLRGELDDLRTRAAAPQPLDLAAGLVAVAISFAVGAALRQSERTHGEPARRSRRAQTRALRRAFA